MSKNDKFRAVLDEIQSLIDESTDVITDCQLKAVWNHLSDAITANEASKGEWRVSPNCSGVVVVEGEPTERDTPESIEYYGGALIAESCRPADAKLIAAAPDLLEALKEYERMYEAIQPEGGWQGVYEGGNAAIKKATE